MSVTANEDSGGFIDLRPGWTCLSHTGTPGLITRIARDHLVITARELTFDSETTALRITTAPGVEQHVKARLQAAELPNTYVAYPEPKDQIEQLLGLLRKDQHISICQDLDVESSDRYTGFDDIRIAPQTLPECDWNDLSLERVCFNRTFAAPLLITGMTGGIEKGALINRRLAAAAQRFRIPMGIGSQRLALKNPEFSNVFLVKDQYPDIFLISNIGIGQMIGNDLATNYELCRRAVDMVGADALAIHVNILQEVIQVEGDRCFRGFLNTIEQLTSRLPVPLMVKEVGSGIDIKSAKKLADAGVAALDVGGKGGTSWSFIEGQRATDQSTRSIAESFRDWGIPTAFCLDSIADDKALRNLDIIATGGIRDGLTMAKAIGLGATMVGVGLPLFRAALESESAVVECVKSLLKGLKTSMICSGCLSLTDLRGKILKSQKYRQQRQDFGMES